EDDDEPWRGADVQHQAQQRALRQHRRLPPTQGEGSAIDGALAGAEGAMTPIGNREDHHPLMRALRFATMLAVVVLSCQVETSILSADEWMLPEPASFHARGMSLVAEVFPPASRQNSGSRALCYFYEVAYPGERWDVKAQLKWKRELAND